MKILVSLFITLFILSGCGSQKRVVIKQKELPSWYVKPTKSTTTTLFAVGEGRDKQEAIANALNNMASTLSVSLSSEFNTKSVIRDGDIQSNQTTSINEINTKVDTIRINSFEVINSQSFGFKKYLAEVKADKRKLFLGLQKEIDQKLNTIQNKNKEAQNYNAIKRLSIYKEAKFLTKDIKHTLLVMNTLNASFDDRNYINKVQDIDNKYERISSKISFKINSNNDAKNLQSSIANGLTNKKYKIKNSGGVYNFKIYISSKTSKAK